MKLSCTSVMLPRWDLDRTFDKLAEHGYDGIELRCRYNPGDDSEAPSFWGRHLSDVSPDNIIQKGIIYESKHLKQPARTSLYQVSEVRALLWGTSGQYCVLVSNVLHLLLSTVRQTPHVGWPTEYNSRRYRIKGSSPSPGE